MLDLFEEDMILRTDTQPIRTVTDVVVLTSESQLPHLNYKGEVNTSASG
jgi:hypothetical protein